MNNKINHIKNLQNLLIIFIFVGYVNLSKSQTILRESIGSCGTSGLMNGTLIQQTIGQPYATNTSYANGITFRPGFQQPVFKMSVIRSSINLTVFPNPASELVTILSQEELKDVVIQVIEITGKVLIYQQISEFKSFSFNCESWANGVYMVSVSDSKNSKYSSKLVILK